MNIININTFERGAQLIINGVDVSKVGYEAVITIRGNERPTVEIHCGDPDALEYASGRACHEGND